MELKYALLPVCLLSMLTGTCHVKFATKSGSPMTICKYQKTYNTLISIGILSASIWSLHGKFKCLMGVQVPILFTLNIFSQISLTIGVTMQSILPIFTKNEFVHVLSTIIEADERLKINTKRHYLFIRWTIIVMLFLFNVCAFSVMALDAILWERSFGFKFSQYYLTESVMIYSLTMQAIQFYVILILLRQRFKYVNQLLPIGAKGEYFEIKSCTATVLDLKETNLCLLSGKHKQVIMKAPSVRELSRIHEKLYESATSLNTYFGFLIVIVCFQAMVLVVQSVYMSFVFGTGLQTSLIDNYDRVLGTILAFAWALYCFIIVAVMTGLCEGVVNAANISGITAHKVLLNDKIDDETAGELNRFAAQIQQQNLYFSGFGLFDVNLTTLTQLIGVCTSYIIIALQFEGMT